MVVEIAYTGAYGHVFCQWYAQIDHDQMGYPIGYPLKCLKFRRVLVKFSSFVEENIFGGKDRV